MIPPATCARASGAGCGSSAWSAQRPCAREAVFGLLGGELPGLGGYAGFFIKSGSSAFPASARSYEIRSNVPRPSEQQGGLQWGQEQSRTVLSRARRRQCKKAELVVGGAGCWLSLSASSRALFDPDRKFDRGIFRSLFRRNQRTLHRIRCIKSHNHGVSVELEILGKQLDLRTHAPVIYAQCSINDYLKVVGDKFFDFSIQRRREKFSAYSQMKEDIVNGTLLPTITLAVSIDKVPFVMEAYRSGSTDAVREALISALPLNILDGLQRTYILRDLFDSGHLFPPNQTVHLEIRAEPDLRHLIYRIIVLNAGQKPMSMRHQIEILSLSLKDVLEREIPGLELVPEVDGGRRTKARKFALDRVSSAYHAFIIKSPEIEKQNLVAQRLSEESILHQEISQFGEQFLEFIDVFKKYCLIDDAVEIFPPDEDGGISALSWLGNENTINAFFAAVADFGSDGERKARIYAALDNLIKSIELENSYAPLGLASFQKIITGFPSRKTNIGYATRKLILVAFKEFFRDEGRTPLAEIWAREAE